MALNVTKVSQYEVGLKIMALTSVKADLLEQLDAAGYGIKVGENNFQFWIKTDKPEDDAIIDTVKFNDFAALKDGTLTPGVHHALSTLLTNKIKTILGNQNSAMAMLPKKTQAKPKSESSYDGDDIEEEDEWPDEDTIPNKPPVKAKLKSGKAEAVEVWPVYAGDIQAGERVLLKDAEQLYQPVYATSGGSRYFMIAGCPDLKMACRYNGDSISIRVEGKKMADFAAGLKMCGFTMHSKYSSVHLSPPKEDPTLPVKTIGAIMFAIGAPWRTPVPDIAFIRNKGE